MKSFNCMRKGLLRKYHTLCSLAGMTADDKLALLQGYGVESSANLSIAELVEVCNVLDGMVNAELNKLRKRCIAAIGGYLRSIGKIDNIDVIKAIACRATGYDSFNGIPKERLRNIYNSFRKKSKDLESVESIADEMVNTSVFGNVNKYKS